MLSTSVKLVLNLVVAVFLLSGPARAATVLIEPDAGPYALVVGNLYTSFQFIPDPNSTGSDTYKFTLATATIGTLTSAISLGATELDVGIANLKAEWFNGAMASLGSKIFSNPDGSIIDASAVLTLALVGIGNYFLVISGTTLSGGGSYLLNVATFATPLPPALILFGTALIGLLALGRRRRSTGPGLAA